MMEKTKDSTAHFRRSFEDFLPPENVLYGARLTSQRQVLSLIAEKAATRCSSTSQEILHGFVDREKLGSTALGNRVALPHTRLDSVNESFAVFLRSRNAIPFEAPDEEGVELFFALLAPNGHGSRYLHDLSRLARLLRRHDVRLELAAEDSPKKLWTILRAAYKKMDEAVDSYERRNGHDKT